MTMGNSELDRQAEDRRRADDRTIADLSSQDSALFQLLGKALKPYRWWMIMALILMLGVSALNALPPLLLQQAIDGPIAEGNVAGLVWITLLYGLTAVGIFILTYGFTYFLQHAGQRALADLRVRLFDQILLQDPAFFGSTSTGDLVSRLTSDIDTLNAVLSNSIVTILVEGVTLIVIVVVMFALNWRLALLSLSILPLVAVVTWYFRKRIRRSSGSERSALARISAFMNENLHGMTVLQLFGREDESEQEFDDFNSGYREALINLRWHSAVFLSVQEILAAVGLALVLYGGGMGVLAGWASLGMLVAFIQYTERAFQPVLRLSQQYNAVQIALGAAERIYNMLNTEPVIRSPEHPTPMPALQGAIEFRDVHFAYVPDEPVLRGVSLEIPPGQSVAIVGATGAGKSSMVSLLARQHDPQEGEIFLDGVDLRQLSLDDLRRSIVVVPQQSICMAGSIGFNIRLYDDTLSDEDVGRAAAYTNADQFIQQLPGGYDFEVLPGGANLSQGQRQLLSLARALALCPDGVSVLDEATSSIDTTTEALIQEALDRILSSRTSLVIAHRLSTVRNADRIIVMERGRIVEDGDHKTLMAQGGYYADLQQHQMAPAMAAGLA